MREQTGNFWRFPADAHCITTNGYVNAKGLAVMGRGVALQARNMYGLALAEVFGRQISELGNRVRIIPRVFDGNRMMKAQADGKIIVAFPVKHIWNQPADLELIKRSAGELVILATGQSWQTVALVRPGCGNGQLDWADVRPVIEPILDDRFVVVQR